MYVQYSTICEGGGKYPVDLVTFVIFEILLLDVKYTLKSVSV